ncbi:MAG: endolytic transglycosylase MltG [Myxococcota bacterium]
MLAAVGAAAWTLLVYPDRQGPGTGRVVDVRLEPGGSIEDAAAALGEAGVVAHPRLFAAYARFVGADERLRDGRIVLPDDLTPAGVLPHIARGFGTAWVRVPIPEGFTRYDIAERLGAWGITDAQAFLEATGSPDEARRLGIEARTLEGYLFPATYQMGKGTPPREVARELVASWRRHVMPVLEREAGGLAALQRELGWGLHEVVTLASIVEKEAAVPEERSVIAGVFLNRLRDPGFVPKRLQADPTVAYGCLASPALASSCAEFDGRITGSMLRDDDNPYNTYRAEGLPPGPIANPGLSSIRAVLAPAEHDYLYFVARGGGRHHFSASLEEHAEVVRRRELEATP